MCYHVPLKEASRYCKNQSPDFRKHLSPESAQHHESSKWYLRKPDPSAYKVDIVLSPEHLVWFQGKSFTRFRRRQRGHPEERPGWEFRLEFEFL